MRKVVYNSSGQIEEDIRYCYDGDQVIAEYDGSGNRLRRYVYGSGIDEPVCMINVDGQAETVYYYHFDGLGSVRGLSDESGEIVEKYEYDVFGKLTATEGTESTENPYYFTARRLDSETSLYYYRARYYAPNIGRFMQGDPLGLDPAGGKYNPFNPVRQYADGANLYAYVKNNPITNIDPYGLKCHYKEQCKKIGKVYICPPQNTQGNCQDCCDYLYDNLAKPSWLHPCKRFKWYLARKNIMTACLFRV